MLNRNRLQPIFNYSPLALNCFRGLRPFYAVPDGRRQKYVAISMLVNDAMNEMGLNRRNWSNPKDAERESISKGFPMSPHSKGAHNKGVRKSSIFRCYVRAMLRINFKRWIFTSAAPRWSLGAIVAILIGLSAFALWQTSNAANDVDRERTAIALNAMIKSHVQRLEVVTAEQAYSDQAADQLYRNGSSGEGLSQDWTDATLGDDYDLAFAITPFGQQMVAVDQGEQSHANHAHLYASAIAQLTSQITDSSDCVGGVVATKDGPRLLAVARVRPISDDGINVDYRKRPAYIAFSKRLSGDMLAHISSSLGVAGLKVVGRQLNTASATDSIRLGTDVGREPLWLEWKPALPGKKALAESAPVIFAGLVFAFCIIALLASLITRLLRASLRDTLSYLPNRRALELQIDRNQHKARDQALAILDIDGLKRVNDGHGNNVGDAAIRHFSNLLRTHAPDDAIIARIGGDGFAVLTSGPGCEDRITAALQSLFSALHEPQLIGGRTIRMAASAGYDAETLNHNNPDELIRRADMALMIAKQRCRGGYLAYSPAFDADSLAQARLARQIEAAIEDDQISIHFQPLVDARCHAVVSAEALLRWSAAAGITENPERVILAAEAHGLGSRLGLAIIRQSCTAALQWDNLPIAVNVTPSQLLSPDLPISIGKILEETGFPAHRLELEVTENIAVQDEALVGQQLTELRNLGISLALDDFGSGYASIGFLRQFKFDKLKIDKSLVHAASSSKNDYAILAACITTAHALGLKVVAEGIEHPAQAELLRVVGCDILQGYLFSTPVASGDFEEVWSQLSVAATDEAVTHPNAKIPLIRKQL
jgi:diguanylate cyclase (GGDEF)-like protein